MTFSTLLQRSEPPPPSKMAKPHLAPVNSFAVCVSWVPPLDVAGKRLKSRLGLGSAAGKQVIRGFRLRYRVAPLGGVGGAGGYLHSLGDGQGEMADAEETWPAEARFATLTWLEEGVPYIFEVTAFNDFADGEWSDPSDPFVLPAHRGRLGDPRQQLALTSGSDSMPPGRPVACSNDPHSVELAWEKPSERGSRIVSYEVMYSMDNSFPPGATTIETLAPQDPGSAEVRVVVDGLEPNSIYYFRHRAVNTVGGSPWSLPTPGVATAAQPPTAPAPPASAGSARAFEVTIKWEPPFSSGMAIQSYRVRLADNPKMQGAVEVPIGFERRGTRPSTGARPDSSSSAALLPRGTLLRPKSASAATRPTTATSGEHALANLRAQLLSGVPTSPPASAGGLRPVSRPGAKGDLTSVSHLRVKGLRPATSYFFQVKAINQMGESEWSSASAAVKTLESKPGRCAQVTFVANCAETRSMIISWPVPDAFGSPITMYDLRVDKAAMLNQSPKLIQRVPVQSVPNIPPHQQQYVQATVPPEWSAGIEHYFQVRAWNSAGAGEWSRASEPIKPPATLPPSVQAPSKFVILPRTIIVSWQKADDCNGEITGYRLRYSLTADMGKSTECVGLRGAETSFAVTSLVPNQNYFFQVAALNEAGCSTWSGVSRPVSLMPGQPMKMSSPFKVDETATTITVSFTKPGDLGTGDGQLISSYVVRCALSAEALLISSDSPPSTKSLKEGEGNPAGVLMQHAKDPEDGVVFKSVPPGRMLYFDVSAVNEFGMGEPSDHIALFKACARPGKPVPPTVENIGETWVVLNLLPEALEQNGAFLTDYRLRMQDMQSEEVTEMYALPLSTCRPPGMDGYHQHMSDLGPGCRYRFGVCIANDQGWSDWSDYSEVTQTSSSAPCQVDGLQAVDVGIDTYVLTWDVPGDNGAAITGYTVSYGSRDGNVTLFVEGAKATCTNCAAGKISKATVQAHNVQGMGPFSEPLEVQMHVGPPYAPRRLYARDVTCTGLTLKWMLPMSDGGAVIERFHISYRETGEDCRPEGYLNRGTLVLEGQRCSCPIEQLAAGVAYEFQVAGENAKGVGPWSPSTDSVRLKPAEEPGAPGKPKYFYGKPHQLAAFWDAGEPMGELIIDQVVQLSPHPKFPAGNRVEVVIGPNRSLPPVEGFTTDVPLAPYIWKKGKHAAAVAAERAAAWYAETSGAAPKPDVDGDLSAAETDSVSTAKPGISLERRRLRMTEEEVAAELEAKWRGRVHELPGLHPGTWYFVRVAARNAVGQSRWSETSDKMETLPLPPAAISSIRAKHLDHESITITWDAPDCHGRELTEYRVHYAALSAKALQDESDRHEMVLEAAKLGDTPEVRLIGLPPGTVHFVKAMSSNCKGPSTWSSIAGPFRTHTMPPARMVAPTPVTEFLSPRCVAFGWLRPDGRGAPVKRYEVKYVVAFLDASSQVIDAATLFKDGRQVFVDEDAVNGGLPNFFSLGVKNMQSVVCSVRALNSAGWGEWSELSVPCRTLEMPPPTPKKPIEKVPPPAPEQPGVPQADEMAIAPRSTVVSWMMAKPPFIDPEREDLAPFSLTYVGFRLLAVRTSGEELVREWTQRTSAADSEKLRRGQLSMQSCIEDLSPGSCYKMQVCAATAGGCSPWSDTGPAWHTDADRPEMDVEMGSEYQSSNLIRLMWSPPQQDNGAPIEGYEVRWTCAVDEPLFAEWECMVEEALRARMRPSDLEPDMWTLDMLGLESSAPFHFRFRARNAIGFSPWSEVATFWTRAARPDRMAPPEVMCTLPEGRVTLSWEAPDCSKAVITRFDLMAAPRRYIINWARFACSKLWFAPDVDRLVGVDRFFAEAEDDKEAIMKGLAEVDEDQKSLGILDCDHAICASLPPDARNHSYEGFVPGRDYFFVIRAVGEAGKGRWSRVVGPVHMEMEPPRRAEPLRVEMAACWSCRFSFNVPYDGGSPILDAVANIRFLRGPAAEKDDGGNGTHGTAPGGVQVAAPVAPLQRAERQVRFDPHGSLCGGGEGGSSGMSPLVAAASANPEVTGKPRGDGKVGGERQRPMVVAVLGVPGVGKRTQCDRIRAKYGLIHLTLEGILQEHVRRRTGMGQDAKDFLEAEEAVPEDLVAGMIKQRLAQDDVRELGCVLHGFPQSQGQLQAIANASVRLDAVIFLDAPDDVLDGRRRVKAGCGGSAPGTAGRPGASASGLGPRPTLQLSEQLRGQHALVQEEVDEALMDRTGESLVLRISDSAVAGLGVIEQRAQLERALSMFGETPLIRVDGAPSPEQVWSFVEEALDPVEAAAALGDPAAAKPPRSADEAAAAAAGGPGGITPPARRFAFTIGGLIPGAVYEVQWACRNALGLAPLSAPVEFGTKASVPATPKAPRIAQVTWGPAVPPSLVAPPSSPPSGSSRRPQQQHRRLMPASAASSTNGAAPALVRPCAAAGG